MYRIVSLEPDLSSLLYFPGVSCILYAMIRTQIYRFTNVLVSLTSLDLLSWARYDRILALGFRDFSYDSKFIKTESLEFPAQQVDRYVLNFN